MTTFRLSVTAAIAEGRSLRKGGWQVFITDFKGVRYFEFDDLTLSWQEPDPNRGV